AGDTSVGVMTAAFTNVFKAQGATLQVETVHPFAAGDAHGLILFFVIVAVIISTLIAQVVLFTLAASAGAAPRIGVAVVYAVLSGLTAMGLATWIAGDFGGAFWTATGLVMLASAAVGLAVAGFATLRPGRHRARRPRRRAPRPGLVGRPWRQPDPPRVLPRARALDARAAAVQRAPRRPVLQRRGDRDPHGRPRGVDCRRPRPGRARGAGQAPPPGRGPAGRTGALDGREVARTGRRPGTGGTREKILGAARAHFARSGFEAATVRAIAADAQVDPALVLHYFGSK